MTAANILNKYIFESLKSKMKVKQRGIDNESPWTNYTDSSLAEHILIQAAKERKWTIEDNGKKRLLNKVTHVYKVVFSRSMRINE